MTRALVSLCVVLVIGTVAFALLALRNGRDRDVFAAHASTANARTSALETQLTTAAREQTASRERMGRLETELAEAAARLTRTEEIRQQLAGELAQTRSALASARAEREALAQELAVLQRDLASARAALIPPGTIEGYRTTIADLERRLAEASRLSPRGPAATATKNLPVITSRVLSVGPSSAFVVLDYGSDHGAAVGQRLVVRRGSHTVAELLISEARPQLSIGQVQPDSLRGVLHKGDSAVLTN